MNYLYAGRVLAVLSLLFGVGWYGHHLGYTAEHDRRVAEVSALKAQAATALAVATEQARKDQDAIVQQQAGKLHDAELQSNAVRADHDRAVRAGNSLQQRIAELAARCDAPSPVAAASAPGPAASAPGDVLAYVQRRIDAAAQEFADFADAAADHGRLCAADYEIAREALARGKAP